MINFIKKDLEQIPRQYIEDVLIENNDFQKDETNSVTEELTTTLLNNQYDKIGQYAIPREKKKDLFELLENGIVDFILIDNHVEMTTKLSYPKKGPYKNSPSLLITSVRQQ
ncbi:MAG: hypothetical protein Q9M36_05820 [Sulfurovum sp.]|nr:hypothetical protein [Sulfurovum sp.]